MITVLSLRQVRKSEVTAKYKESGRARTTLVIKGTDSSGEDRLSVPESWITTTDKKAFALRALTLCNGCASMTIKISSCFLLFTFIFHYAMWISHIQSRSICENKHLMCIKQKLDLWLPIRFLRACVRGLSREEQLKGFRRGGQLRSDLGTGRATSCPLLDTVKGTRQGAL